MIYVKIDLRGVFCYANDMKKDDRELIKEIITRYLDEDKYDIFLFGSIASGNENKYSDYDIGIIGKNEVPGYKIANIQADLEESNILRKVDVVDFSIVTKNFKKTALKKIIKL